MPKRNFLQKTVNNENQQICIDGVRELLVKHMSEFSEEYDMDCKITHNASNNTDEYYLETVIEEYNFDLWVIVMISSLDQKIYVGNRCVFRSFDLCEAEIAVEYVKHLLQLTNEKLKRNIKIFCEEFNINQKQYEIVCNSIISILEKKQKEKNIDIGYDYADKTVMSIYLHYPNDISKMYKICITYNEFLRNPRMLEQIIDNPRRKTDWNFRMKKQKYHKEYFRNIREL